ncbi:MAG TPA: ATP-binding protein [Acidimicrobiales bacterium]|nr:ATP-binding protein [Acidimicrobiales bacterium]
MSVRLGVDTTAPGEARRVVDAALRRWGCTAATDDVLLCVSELATNAVVHGAPPAVLVVTDADPGVVVEVADAGPIADDFTLRARVAADPAMPRSNHPGGRGLLIVDHLADTWGLAQRPVGKTVWCAIATGRATTETAPVALRTLDVHTIVLREVPVRLMLDSERHLDALVGALRLAALKGDPGSGALADELDGHRSRHVAERNTALGEALRRVHEGGDRLDVTLRFVDDPGRAAPEFAAAVDAAEAWCEATGAPELVADEELARYRRWYLTEIVSQTDGRDPRPCPFPAG